MNEIGTVALAQLVGLTAGLMAARVKLRSAAVAFPTLSDRRAAVIWFLVGSALLLAIPAGLISLRLKHVPSFFAVACLAALLYIPLSGRSTDQDDESPVPYSDSVKLMFAVCALFASLGGLAALLWLR